MSRSSPSILTSPRHGSLRRRLAHSTALAGMLAAAPVAAQLPTGESVEGGIAAGVLFDRVTDPNTLGVSLTNRRSVINWESFNIDSGKTVDFRNTLPTTTAPVAVLNRVVGTPVANGPNNITSSVINGSMTSASNIAVYLVNPAGILIGGSGNVSVGSLVLSSRAISSGSFNGLDLDANRGDQNFAVNPRDASTLTANPDALTGGLVASDVLGRVIVGDRTSGSGTITANAGIVALIAAKVENYGSVTATSVVRSIAGDDVRVGGEVAIVAADDVTLTLNGGSPMGVTIAAGTVLATPVLVRGTIAGRSILAAAATQQTITDALLDVQGTLLATTATATDRGIVLAAGRTTTLADGVTMPAAVAGDQPALLRLGGTLQASGVAGTIDIRASGGVTAPIVVAPATTALPPATLIADESVLVRADAGGIALGNVTNDSSFGTGIDLSAGTGNITTGSLRATAPFDLGGAVSVQATAGQLSLGTVIAGDRITLRGTSITAGSVLGRTAASVATLTSTVGNISVGGVQGSTVTITSAGNYAGGSDTRAYGAQLRVTANDVSGDTFSSRTSTTITATGNVVTREIGSVLPTGDVNITAVGVSNGSAGGVRVNSARNLTITASGDVALTTGTAELGTLNVTGTTVTATTGLTAGTTLNATASTGSLQLGGTSSGGTTTLRAATSANVTGDAISTAGAIDVRGASVSLGTANANTTLDVTSTGTTLNLTNGIAGTVATIRGQTTATVDSLSAGSDARLTAGTTATLSGNASAGNDLLVSGANVVLGGTAGAKQEAVRNAFYTATAGTITGATTSTGLVIRADNAPPPAGVGAIVLDARDGIDTTGITLVTGQDGGATTGKVGIRLTAASAPLALGTVQASALQVVDAGHTTFSSPLTTTGAVTLGATQLVDSLTLSTPGAIRLSSVAISGSGQTLTITGTDTNVATRAGNTVTATGTLSAAGGVTVRAPGAVELVGVTGNAGATTLESTVGSLNATGTVSGASVSLRAATALTTPGTVTSTTGGIDAQGASAGLNVVNARTTLDVTSTTTTLGLQQATAGTTATLTAATNATIGTVDASRIVASATGGNLTATRLTATQSSTATDALNVTARTLTVTTAEAINADARLNATSGTATVVAGRAGRDLIVAGNDVSLGGATGEQRAGRNADYTARTGTITALPGGVLTIRGDASGSRAGRIILDAAGSAGINLAGSALVTGQPGGANTGDVAIRLVAAGAPLTLGTVDANALVSVTDAAHTNFTAFSTTGPVTLGATNLVNSLDLSTPGNISLSSLAVSGANQTLTIRGTGAAATIMATGDLSAPGAVTVSAPGNVSLAGVSGGAITLSSTNNVLSTGALQGAGSIFASGNTGATFTSVRSTGADATIVAYNGDLTAGALSAATFAQAAALGSATLGDVTAGSGLVYLYTLNGSLQADAVSAGTSVYAEGGTTLSLDSVATDAGPATLTSPGTLTVSGFTRVQGDVSAAATGTGSVQMGEVTSRGGVVTLSSANAAVTAGDVSANRALTAGAGTNLSLLSASSTSANIGLTAGGTLNVTNATAAQTDVVTSSGGAQTLGSVDSRAGAVTLGSSTTLNAAAVSSQGALSATGPAGVTLASALSRGSTVTLGAGAGAITVNGATDGQGAVDIRARNAIGLRAVTSRSGGITVLSNLGTVGATGLTAVGAIDVQGQTGVSLTGAATSSGSSIAVRAPAGTIGTTALDAATNVTATGQGNLTLGIVTARGLVGGVPTGGAATLTSASGGIDVTSVATRTTLDATAATTLGIATGAIGTTATLSGRDLTLGTFGAGVLSATANGGDLTVTAGDIRGQTTLTKNGAVGGISIARLTAVGPTQITSGGVVRADRLEGGATNVNAVGDISGRTGGLGAGVTSLTVNSSNGSATIGVVTTSGTTNVTARNATLLTDTITAGADLIASGGSVTLGTAGTPVIQSAAGQVQVTSTSGDITGLADVALRSNNGGVAGAGRDLTLQSNAGITFGSNTVLAGGTDRQSALRLSAGSGAPISLQTVQARTILSTTAGATRFEHNGPVSIASVATGESLDIRLFGAGNPALTLGSVDVRSGILSLDAAGALTTGSLGVLAGTTTLAGASVSSGAITTRGLTATARTGAATFTTIEATAGSIVANAATDLSLTNATASTTGTLTAGGNVRLTSITTSGALGVTSTAGDVTGNAIVGGFAPAALTSTNDVVTVRANATDGTRGAILAGAIVGGRGIDIAGRAITAESLRSSAGPVTASTARDLAGLTSQPMTIGTIDAAGTITLATGNRTVASAAPLALDRATSTGGNIAITTIGGGLTARSGSPRTILSAPNGTITLAIGGSAVLGSASGRTTTITGTSIDLASAAATNGALALTATGGPLTLGTGNASGAATLDASGAATVGDLTGASVTIGAASVDVTTATTTGGALAVTARSGALTLGTGTVAGAATLDASGAMTVGELRAASAALIAASMDVTTVASRGTLALTTRGGALVLGTGTADGAATLTAAGPMAVTSLTAASAGLNGTGDATLGTVRTTGGDLGVTIRNALDAVTLDSSRGIAVDAGSARITNADARGTTLALTTRTGLLRLDAGSAGTDATIVGPTLSIGTLDARATGTLTAAGDLTADRLTTGGALTAGAGQDATLTTVQAGADARLSAGRALSVNAVTTPTLLTLVAPRIDVVTLNAGSLAVTGGANGIDLQGSTISGAASVVSDAGLALGNFAAGSASLTAATDLTADTLGITGALALTAQRIAATTTTAGSLTADAGSGGIDLRTATVTNGATIGSAADIAIGTLDAGSATLTAATALAADRLTTTGAMALTAQTIGVTTTSAGALTARAGAGGLMFADATVANAAAIDSAGAVSIGTLDAGSADISAATTLRADTLTIGQALGLTGAAIQVTNLTAASLQADGGTGGVDFGTAAVAGTTRVASGATLTFGTLAAGTADLSAATDLTGTDLGVRGALTAAAGRDLTIATVAADGDAALQATRTLAVGSATTPGALTLTGATVGAMTIDSGSLGIAAGLGGFTLDTGTVARLATLTSGADVTIGSLQAGTIDITAAGALTADLLAASDGLSIAAASARVTTTRVTGGATRIRTGDEGLVLDDLTTAGGLDALTTGVLTAGTLDIGGRLDATGASASFANTRVTGGAALTTTSGGLDVGQAEIGGATTLAAATDLSVAGLVVGDVLGVTAGGPASLVDVRAQGDTSVTAGTIRIGTLTTPAGLALTAGRIDATTLDAGSLVVTAGSDGAGLTTTTVGGATLITSDGGVDIGTLDSGSSRITAAGALVADTLLAAADLATNSSTAGIRVVRAGAATLTTTAGDLSASDVTTIGDLALTSAAGFSSDTLAVGGALDASATTNGSVGAATIGANATLSAGNALLLGSMTTPAQASLTARQIGATTLGAGVLTVRAGTGGADLRTTTVAGVADIASGAGLTIGALTAGPTTLTAVGALTADTLGVSGALTASAASMGVRIVRAGTAAMTTTAGNLSASDVTTTGDLALTSAAAFSSDRLAVGGALTASAATDGNVGTATVARNATLSAGNALLLGSMTTPAQASLTARQIGATTLGAGVLTVRAGTGGADLRTTTVAGAADIASGAGLTIGALTAGPATLAASGALTADALDVTGDLTGTAATMRIGTATVRNGSARLTASNGGITLGTATIARDAALTGRSVALGSFTATGALALTAADSASADTLRVGGRFTSASGALTARSTTVGGDASLTGGTVALTNATIGGNAAVDVTGRASADALDVGGRLTASTPTLVLGTATVRGGTATLTVGTADIGQLTSSGATGITARGAITATRLDAAAITASAASVAVDQAIARAGDIALTAAGAAVGQAIAGAGATAQAAAGGDIRLGTASASGAVGLTSSGASAVSGAITAGTSYRIDAASIALGTAGATVRQAAADVTLLARTGAIAGLGTTTLAGTRTVSLTARGGSGAITFAPETTISSSSADVVLATTGAAALGTVTGSTAIRLDAADAALTRAITAPIVTLTNVATSGVTRLGDAALGNETEFGANATRFDLTNAEVNLIASPTVTIASGARDVVLGTVGLGATTGSTRFAVTATGRIDMLGRFVAANSTASRTIVFGNDASATTTRTGVIRIASTQGEGGRLLVDGAVLELSADRIGAGLDRDFLDNIGYRTTTGLDVEQVTQQYVARPTSTLYTPGALGAAPYTDAILVRAGVLRLTYGRYALFQNTGLPGQQAGVVLGTAGETSASGPKLRLSTPNSSGNAFALFGTIDGISSQATALLGPDRLQIDSGVSPVASRINGCIIGSGGGCLNTNIAQPSLNLFDTSRAEIVRTADDLTLPFDPLIGTNNEALYLDTIGDLTAPECEGDKPCPTKP